MPMAAPISRRASPAAKAAARRNCWWPRPTAGDYAFLDVSKPAFDLTDRGVEGRPSPGPLDLFATTERGVYRPGETVFLTALLRDTHAKAVADLPLTIEVERPDGVVATREVLNDEGAGGYFAALPLVADAMRGSWTIRLYADPKAAPLANVTLPRRGFRARAAGLRGQRRRCADARPATSPRSMSPPNISMAPPRRASSVEADAVLRPVTTLAGLSRAIPSAALDDTIETDREPLGVVGTTDESGNATAEVTLPEPQATTRPLEAQIILRLVDTNGRTVERSLTRPVLADVDRIGIKPQFDDGDGLAEGSEAGFDIIAVAPTGETIAKTGLNWTLSRVETNYQWYRDSGTWKWEAITTTREVANGTRRHRCRRPGDRRGAGRLGPLPARSREHRRRRRPRPATNSMPAIITPKPARTRPTRCRWRSTSRPIASATPPTLRLDPQFAGTALVMVVDDRIIDMVAVDGAGRRHLGRPAGHRRLGPGRLCHGHALPAGRAPPKSACRRARSASPSPMSSRATASSMSTSMRPTSRCRASRFTATVKLGNVAAGQKAYVAVAAVDLGILNLTNFKAPDPDGWFFGQRQLGMEVRDLYGQLIDPTQGMPGAHALGRRRRRGAARHAAADLGAGGAAFRHRRGRRRRQRHASASTCRISPAPCGSWPWPGPTRPWAMARPTSSSAIRWS